MLNDVRAIKVTHLLSDYATHLIARLARRPASLLVVAGVEPASSSRLASRLASRTLGRVQLRFLGLRPRDFKVKTPSPVPEK